MCFVRLACVRHAASVHPEPGSNSQIKNQDVCSGPEPLVLFLSLLSLSVSALRLPQSVFRFWTIVPFHGPFLMTSLSKGPEWNCYWRSRLFCYSVIKLLCVLAQLLNDITFCIRCQELFLFVCSIFFCKQLLYIITFSFLSQGLFYFSLYFPK